MLHYKLRPMEKAILDMKFFGMLSDFKRGDEPNLEMFREGSSRLQLAYTKPPDFSGDRFGAKYYDSFFTHQPFPSPAF
jgi:hypothetical protein